ncbi:MAG: CBS domain-containing protein [Acidobacteriota bacterium]|nr:CBS domain-containing protein [Acidobacteriota bacterium]MDE3030614.1 CBS domain-containing protein [Acidobacteriota bacterium]MDE3092695.1 CBS domain-containing protein [Acidobacteriota bacterium]MDE3139085.1 CBS domain-containing protein [Acidobacteriota bacterium]MDE3147579.1 CBS domain-containing protein [Acidobacteriota bacterium]
MRDEPPTSGLARFRARVGVRPKTTSVSPEAAAIHARVDQLSTLELRDVMTPRVDVVFLAVPVTPEAVAEAVRDTGHSCFPVVDGDLDDVEGVLFVNDLFRSTTAKRAIGVSLPSANEIARKIRRPLMLPETLDLLESLKEMREQSRTFALVLDEHGGVAGVISIRDILEQLVGDLSDEFDEDEEPTIVKIRAGRWLVDGQTHVDKVSEALGLEIPEGEYVTFAGYILDLAGEIPAAGSVYTEGDWSFRVQSVTKRRISEIVAEYHEPPSVLEADA